MNAVLDHQRYYRLPWSYSDNVISWLEPTKKCNLRCEGCYRDTSSGTHKTLEQVRSDLEVFKKYRKSDCVSIAGGDPLMHPEIVDIVRMVATMGWKPIVNTNGLALSPELLKKLKRAGACGFTFHIDTSQNRPKHKQETEADLNVLRQHYAEMLAREGGLACSFNSTISIKTLHEVPALVEWARAHADIVHSMVFILYRSPELSGDLEYYVYGQKVDFGSSYKETGWGGDAKVKASDIVQTIRREDPLYEPCAYLNGTAKPESTKWLLASRVVLGGQVMGYVSPKFMEVSQSLHHVFRGRYLGYASPKTTSRAKLWTYLTSIWDPRMRTIAGRLLMHSLNPMNMFRKAYLQSIMIIQPIDVYEDGRQDMCDGCPDITVFNGKLVWSCRLEEMEKYGCFATTRPVQRTGGTV